MSLSMPIIRPVIIKTKGKSFWKKIFIWLFKSRQWELVEDYYIFIPWLDITVKIEKGFIFDGASIPKIFWPLLSPTGLLFIPGLMHDYGYKYNYWKNTKGDVLFFKAGQHFFDEQFGKLGAYINEMIILDKIAFIMLRSFGWIAWCNHRRAQKRRMKNGEEN